MKQKYVVCLVLIIVAAFLMSIPASYAASKGSSKVGIFDMQRIIRESVAGKKARETFQKELVERQKLLTKKDEEVRKFQQELMDNKDLDAAELKAKQRELAKENKELARLRSDLQEEMKGMDEELTIELLQDVVNVVRDIGDKDNFSIIFQKTANMVYIDNAIDVTSEVLKKFNAESKD